MFILLFGWAGYLQKNIIGTFSAVYWVVAIFLFRKQLSASFKSLGQIRDLKIAEKLLIIIIVVLALINLIGALGPELAFDALWYHLTIPKIYILDERTTIIPGNLLYYSGLPKLGEMLFVVGLLFSNEIAAKLIHFSFGIGCIAVTYKIARLYLSKNLSLLASLLFYSNLVVMWLSITAYIDLIRTFYDSLAILALLLFEKKRKKNLLVLSGILAGFAVSAKLISLITVVAIIATILINRDIVRRKAINICAFVIPIALVTNLWVIFNYINTGNMFYPFFEGFFADAGAGFNIGGFMEKVKDLLLTASDPISPIYLISVPLIVISFKKLFTKYRFLLLLVIFSFGLLIVTPYANSRYMVSYLPLYSVVVVLSAYNLSTFFRRILIVLIFFVASVSLFYRAAANYKYLPVVFGKESKEEFLMKNLNFDFGDFYDVGSDDEDGEVKKIVGENKVLLVGIHNLYYADFQFIHESWYKGEWVDYVLVRSELPNFQICLLKTHRVCKYRVVYSNDKTRVKLYRLYEGNN